jgi:hypothetical protein
MEDAIASPRLFRRLEANISISPERLRSETYPIRRDTQGNLSEVDVVVEFSRGIGCNGIAFRRPSIEEKTFL